MRRERAKGREHLLNCLLFASLEILQSIKMRVDPAKSYALQEAHRKQNTVQLWLNVKGAPKSTLGISLPHAEADYKVKGGREKGRKEERKEGRKERRKGRGKGGRKEKNTGEK